MLIPPLLISDAVGGANWKSFREVFNHSNMVLSFSKSGEYEAEGTVWMLDPSIGPARMETLSICQIEADMAMFSEEAFLQSSSVASARRLSFDVPLPAMVHDTKSFAETRLRDSSH